MYCGWELLTPEDETRIMRGVQDGRVYAGPFHLSLFIVNRCNVRCFFCFARDMLETGAILPWDVLRRTLLEAIEMDLRSVSFSGGGEPLLYPQLNELLEFLRQHKISIDFFNTNGVTLTPSLIEKLFDVGLREITFSLNETTPATYSEMMNCPPRFFDRVVQALTNIRKHRETKNARNPQIRIQLMIWRGNYKRLEEMYRFSASLKPDVIYLNTIEQLSDEQRMSSVEREECKTILSKVFEEDRERGLIQINFSQEGLQEFASQELVKSNPHFYYIDGQPPSKERIEYCYTGWFHALIDALGDVYPCCYLMGDPRHVVGNVTRQSMRDIWYGKDYAQFRNEMREIMLSRAQYPVDLSSRRFTMPMCLARAACSFNLLLCSREFYEKMDAWFETGPRRSFKGKRNKIPLFSRIIHRAKGKGDKK